MYRPTPTDPASTVAEMIREHRKNTGGRYGSENYTARETAGQFAAIGGATVEAYALIQFSKPYNYGDPEQRLVKVGASAKCNGHGCTDPEHEQPFTDAVPLDDDADKAGDAVVPLVQAAREWAQAHAEKCRAKPYGGA